MKAGFIGTGSMGTILIESFIHSGALEPEQISASNRTYAKALSLAERYGGLTAYRSNAELAAACELIFLCVKPTDFKNVIAEIRDHVGMGKIVISITSPLQLDLLESKLDCKVAKIIPSITNRLGSGATLCIYGSRIDSNDRDKLETLLRQISFPVVIEELHTRVASDISSCGPAFIAFFVQQLIQAAVDETGISRTIAARLAAEMTLGAGKLLTEGGFSPESLQQHVSVPGGITAEALKLMAGELDGMFNRLIRTTHAKFNEDLDKIETAFLDKNPD